MPRTTLSRTPRSPKASSPKVTKPSRSARSKARAANDNRPPTLADVQALLHRAQLHFAIGAGEVQKAQRMLDLVTEAK